jgi:hypothetical protein
MSETNNDPDNQKFAIGIYLAMFLMGAGILGYGAATGQLKDWMQNNQNAAPEVAADPAEPVASPD